MRCSSETSTKSDRNSTTEKSVYHEEGRVPTAEEIEKWTKFAKVLYTAVLGLHFERQQQKKERQLAIF